MDAILTSLLAVDFSACEEGRGRLGQDRARLTVKVLSDVN